MEKCASHRRRFRENIPRRSVVFTALVTSTELSIWQKQVDVVAADIVLCQVDDCSHQALFTVVVARLF